MADYTECDKGRDDRQRDLSVIVTGMIPHVDNLTEFRLVNDGGFVVLRAIIDGLPAQDYAFTLLAALMPSTVNHLEFYADLSGNRRYDIPSTDHAWRLERCQSGTYRFEHTTDFADIEDPEFPRENVGEDFVINFSGFRGDETRLFELWVRDTHTDRTVGYYRLAAIPVGGEFSLTIPGVIEPNTPYFVGFYADSNNNKRYDEPPEDGAWSLVNHGDASGLHIDFAYTESFVAITEHVPPIPQ